MQIIRISRCASNGKPQRLRSQEHHTVDLVEQDRAAVVGQRQRHDLRSLGIVVAIDALEAVTGIGRSIEQYQRDEDGQ